jgi:endonuclease/exonuclease/phosphatase (EEP) superfamily protein YafD
MEVENATAQDKPNGFLRRHARAFIGFQAITAVTMKRWVFSLVTPCNLKKKNSTFRRNVSLLSSGSKI